MMEQFIDYLTRISVYLKDLGHNIALCFG